ncbi:MAG: MFS transporter, partial [Candidatus Methylomirabilales bacterium]
MGQEASGAGAAHAEGVQGEGKIPALSAPAASPNRERSYLRLLLVLVGTATFFEGYDTAIAAVVLPDLAKSLSAGPATIGRAIAVVGMGAFVALFVTALGDRIGRKPLLIATTFAYAAFTGLTATAQSVAAFTGYQFLARIFLISEYSTAITIVAEEFPAERRGRAIGVLSALGGLGLVAVAVLYRFFAPTSLSWRGLYLVGIIPLLAVGILRTKLRETARFVEARSAGGRLERIPIRRVLAGRYRSRLLRMGAVFFFLHFALLAGLAWWTWHAANERHLTSGQISTLLSTAFPLGTLGYFAAGWLQDRIGRRPTGAIFLLAGMAFGIALFRVEDEALLFPAMVLAVFFGLGANPVISTLASELFPTEIRATSVAVVRSFFGTAGSILGPFVVGWLADPSGPIGNVRDAVTLTSLAFIPGLAFLGLLPETAGRELESIAHEEAGRGGGEAPGRGGGQG